MVPGSNDDLHYLPDALPKEGFLWSLLCQLVLFQKMSRIGLASTQASMLTIPQALSNSPVKYL